MSKNEEFEILKNEAKILTVIGTRPEAIKMAPLIDAIGKNPQVENQICFSGQHQLLFEQVKEIFQIKPDYKLDIFEPEQSLNLLLSKLVKNISEILITNQPDMILVHGDTTTALGAALAAANLNSPISHVEAGLRTYNLKAPFPEEMNRQMISKLATYHFAPTELNRDNLLNEKINQENIFVTGNTVVDSIQIVQEKLLNYPESKIKDQLEELLNTRITEFILVTGHRRENHGEGIKEICDALLELSSEYPEIQIIYPVHLNPNIFNPVTSLLSGKANIFVMPPQDYLTFAWLMKNCKFILTDSGGIQEEAPTLGKKVLLMREQTERPEAIDNGCCIMVGANRETIVLEGSKLIRDKSQILGLNQTHPFGKVGASERIANLLNSILLK